ncbi:MAG TPA: ABC transporter substrate-binding protein [Hyphomicrobiales bacterium]|nr:ABC transporter substrate-binding protein [Hyphomicrobiales bacterium]
MTTTRQGGLDRRDLLKGTAAATGALLLPASVKAAEPGPRKGGTLRVAMPFNPASVDPLTGRTLTDFNVLYALFDGLIDFEPATLKLKPGLAKAWRFADPKTLVLDLVDGVEFHDGTPFNPEAVKFNIERYKTHPRSTVKADLAQVATVEVTGKSQVTLHLSAPHYGLPAILTNRVGLMVSPKSVREADNGNVDRKPVGTGPFTFVDWQDNASITLTRNKNYWRAGLPHLDGLQMRIINELNTATRTAIAGESDLVLNMTVTQKQAVDRVKNVVATVTPGLVFYGAYLNYARPPLDDLRVRQAMNYALDRDAYNKLVLAGLGEPSSTIVPKEFWACDPATADYYRHDPDKAKKLLADAGHAGGIEIPAWGWSDQSAIQRQEIVTSQLAEVGIRVKLTPAVPIQVIKAFMIEHQRAMMIGAGGGYPDPSQLYEALFDKGALRNSGRIELPGYRPLMDATMAAPTEDGRKAAFAKLQRFTVEQAMYFTHAIVPGVTIATPKVKNFEAGLMGTPKFTDVWLEA